MPKRTRIKAILKNVLVFFFENNIRCCDYVASAINEQSSAVVEIFMKPHESKKWHKNECFMCKLMALYSSKKIYIFSRCQWCWWWWCGRDERNNENFQFKLFWRKNRKCYGCTKKWLSDRFSTSVTIFNEKPTRTKQQEWKQFCLFLWNINWYYKR